MNGEAGKGSARRDGSDPVKYAKGWDRIFGKKKKEGQSDKRAETVSKADRATET